MLISGTGYVWTKLFASNSAFGWFSNGGCDIVCLLINPYIDLNTSMIVCQLCYHYIDEGLYTLDGSIQSLSSEEEGVKMKLWLVAWIIRIIGSAVTTGRRLFVVAAGGVLVVAGTAYVSFFLDSSAVTGSWCWDWWS